MKKLFKLVSLAAFAAGVTWMLRDQLVPTPNQPTSEPPPFRSPPAPSTTPPAAKAPTATEASFALQDDLTAVNGIGPVYAKRLAGAGVNSFSDLAGADAAELAALTDLNRDRIADWIRKASDLA